MTNIHMVHPLSVRPGEWLLTDDHEELGRVVGFPYVEKGSWKLPLMGGYVAEYPVFVQSVPVRSLFRKTLRNPLSCFR